MHAKLKVKTLQAQQYVARVVTDHSADYPVASDGRVQFTIPRFSNGCDVYVFGFIKTRDGSAERVSVVELRRGGHIVRKLSLAQIAGLPTDPDGFSIVGL